MARLNFAELRERVNCHTKQGDRTLAAALWYAENSIPVLPATVDGKLPPKSYNISYDNASTKEATIKKWFDRNGQFWGWNLSIPTGPISNIVAVDIDNKGGKNGSELWATLEGAYGELPETVAQASTPSAGIHILFKYRLGFYSTNPSETGSPGLLPGIDTRGGKRGNLKSSGGHILVYPSVKTTDRGERPYEWMGDVGALTEAPDWIVDLINGNRPIVADPALTLPDIVPAGGRDTFLYNYGLRLVARGYEDKDVEMHMRRAGERFSPPDNAMVEAKVRQVLSSEVHNKVKLLKDIGGNLAKNEKSGSILPTVENYYQILQSTLFREKMDISYDTFKERIVAKDFIDYNLDDVYNKIERILSADFRLEKMRQVISNHTVRAIKELRQIDSLQQYFNGLTWDKVDYYSQMLNMLKLHPGSLQDTYLRKWLLSGVARAFIPGAKVDCILVLIGKQGIRKSTFFKFLTPGEHPDTVTRYMQERDLRHWFTDSVGKERTLSHPDELRKLNGKFIGEMAEMHAMNRSEIKEIKHFLTEQAGEYVQKFKEDVIKVPRRFILGGTSNKRDYLNDETGNRRFWNVNLGTMKIDTDWIYHHRDQLWAQMQEIYLAGKEINWLTEDETVLQSVDNQDFESDDSWDSLVLEWASVRSRFTKSDILIYALNFEPYQIKQADQSRVAKILERNAWDCRRVRVKDTQQKLMINPDPRVDTIWAGDSTSSQNGRRWEPKDDAVNNEDGI